MSQTAGLDVFSVPANNGDPRADDGVSIVSLCDEVVNMIAMTNSPDGPSNQPEAEPGSQADIEAASRRQNAIIDRLECLANVIPQRSAASDVEFAAKTRAFDAFASVDAWDRGSLRVFRLSIERDRDRLGQATRQLAPPSPPRQSWLARRWGNHGRVSG